MDIILCSDHLIFVSLAIYRTSQNLLSLNFFICKYLSVAGNGNDTEASLVLPLHSQPGSNTHREGGMWVRKRPESKCWDLTAGPSPPYSALKIYRIL